MAPHNTPELHGELSAEHFAPGLTRYFSVIRSIGVTGGAIYLPKGALKCLSEGRLANVTNAYSPHPPRHRAGHPYQARVSTHEKSEWLRDRTRKRSRAWLTRTLFLLAALAGGRAVEAAPALDAVRQIAPQTAELDWSDTTPASADRKFKGPFWVR